MQRCGLEIINIMNNDATLNAAAGAYEGLDRFEARKQLWRDMKVRLEGASLKGLTLPGCCSSPQLIPEQCQHATCIC